MASIVDDTRIPDSMFVREMEILYQGLLPEQRRALRDLVRNYFDQGDRANRVIRRMKERPSSKPTVIAQIVVYSAPKDIDWSRIADMISEGYSRGIGQPPDTNWELLTE